MSTMTGPPASPRQIVLCCDGTNNTLTAGSADTHVLRVYEHLVAHPAPHRVLFYDPGVGSPGGAPPTDPIDWAMRAGERISGLASGRGIYANVSEAYLFLMRHHRSEHDQIYLFGFSRGAFTARCVAGMVNLFGIIGLEHEVMLPTLIRVYFSLPDQPDKPGAAGPKADDDVGTQLAMRRIHKKLAESPVGRSALAEQIRRDFTRCPGRDAWVHWVGVWDTVESVGMPGPLARRNPSSATLDGKRFHHVRHALAFDEHRWTFEPRLYDEPDDIDSTNPLQTFKQRWFPGVHCDVGGGYLPEHAGLAEATLQWMVREAIDCGLGVPNVGPARASAPRHDALWQTPWWALAGMVLRDMRPVTSKGRPIAVIPGPALPSSAPSVPVPSRATTRTTSVWDERRGTVPLLVAVLLGLLCLLRSGGSLLDDGWGTLFIPEHWRPALVAAARLAQEQLVGPFHQWLWVVRHYDGRAVFWAMFWDLGFIACWGYWLARIASRAFTWLAGSRAPGQPLPAWRLLGFAPLAAVGGDVCEDLLTVAAFAAHGSGTDSWAKLLLVICVVASAVKWTGLLVSLTLIAVRAWIAMPWVRRGPGAQAPVVESLPPSDGRPTSSCGAASARS
ncbi:hypothetical protein BH11PSE8_BH11PSE8_05390 [soil metagenome]